MYVRENKYFGPHYQQVTKIIGSRQQAVDSAHDVAFQRFYAAHDLSLLRHLAKAWKRGEHQGLRFLGQGQDFRNFALVRGTETLVVSFARDNFLQAIPLALQQWCNNLKKLETLKHPLLPPCRSFSYESVLLYTKPYCEEIRNPTAGCLQDIERQIGSAKTALASVGLMIDDYWQIMSWEGRPVVVDLSSLRFINTHQIR